MHRLHASMNVPTALLVSYIPLAYMPVSRLSSRDIAAVHLWVCSSTAYVHTKSPYGHVLPPNPLPGRAYPFTVLRELDDARREGVERVVAAAPDLVARHEARAALPHQNLARVDFLAAEALHAEALAGARAAVLGGAAGLLRG